MKQASKMFLLKKWKYGFKNYRLVLKFNKGSPMKNNSFNEKDSRVLP